MQKESISRHQASTGATWPLPRQAWTATFVLALASMFAQFDRVVFNLNVEPIKTAFSLDDTKFAILQGIAFGLFYVLCAIPIGRLVDRYQRRIVLSVSLAFFSIASMCSGLVKGFGQMFVSRMGVGVGEASITPCGLSMLSDLFPPNKLGRAISLFLISAPLGVGLGFIAGGKLIGELNLYAQGNALPFGLAPWQFSFLLVSLPGLLLVPFAFLLPEPVRKGPGSQSPLSIKQVVDVLKVRKHALVFLFSGFSMQAIMNFAYNIWTPALFARVYGWSSAEIGLAFGLIMVTFGVSGVYFAGWLSDKLAQKGETDSHLRISAYAAIGFGICGCLAPQMPSAWMALCLLAPAMFLISMPVPCVGIALQLILPNRARGQISGLYFTINGLMGLAVGPLIIGIMNDFVFTGPGDIRYSLSVVIGICAPLMCGLLLKALKPYRELRELMIKQTD